MEHIRQAVERARTHDADSVAPRQNPGAAQAAHPVAALAQMSGRVAHLDGARLEDNRIIAHDIADTRSRSFDMLRTQVLQAMDASSWQVLCVTSPTATCGKSVISTNLALSIARQRERSVLLIDLDLQKPQVGKLLGLKSEQGVMSVLEGRSELMSTVIQAHIRNQQILVLPCEVPTMNSSEWMASRQMSSFLQNIRLNFKAVTVILDLPPVLYSDDVISVLPQIDCALLVTAAGVSTPSEIKECSRHLESTPVVRVVVNKAVDAAKPYHYSYGRPPAGPTRRAVSGLTQVVDRLANLGR